MCGHYDLGRLTPAAMAVELTHAATLVHDDVIDRSAVRRGRPTVAARLGDAPAIVIGDHYFAKSYELAARTEAPEVVGILAKAVMEICAGEVRQQAIRHRYSTDITEYMGRIRAKTATLLEACCDIGALLGGLGTKQREALRIYGNRLGLAFQIADDVLDYSGSEGEGGKPIGHDIEDGPTARRLKTILSDGHELMAEQARQVVEIVRASGAPRQATAVAEEYASLARGQLESIEQGEARDALEALTAYVVSRKL